MEYFLLETPGGKMIVGAAIGLMFVGLFYCSYRFGRWLYRVTHA